MMTPILDISNTDEEAIVYAMAHAKQEGWNPGIDDHNTFAVADPTGFFLAKLDNQPIGCASAVCYDDKFAFFGLYIVDTKYRGQGYGIQITKHRLDYVGNRCIGLDGVLENEEIYKKIGFKKDFISERHELDSSVYENFSIHECVKDIAESDMDALIVYDQFCFPAERALFLNTWLNAPHARTLYYKENGEYKGYAVMRQCFQGYKIGPLFADNNQVAAALLNSMLTHANNESVYIDVPDANDRAQEFIRSYNTTIQFACMRMYKNGKPDFDLNRVYGISTFELG